MANDPKNSFQGSEDLESIVPLDLSSDGVDIEFDFDGELDEAVFFEFENDFDE